MNEDQEIKIGLTCSDDANNSGIPNSSEWKNGDECLITNENGYGMFSDAEKYINTKGVVMSVFKNTNGLDVAAVSHDGICICWMLDMLKKPETQEQREERERLEAAYDLYASTINDERATLSFDEFKGYELECPWLIVVDKTGYRLNK